MALPRSLVVLRHLARPRTPLRTMKTLQENCEGTVREPCPPCESVPPPPCRARSAPVPKAKRVVCCAPSVGRRPPCAPYQPACSLNCSNVTQEIPAAAVPTSTLLAVEDTSTCDANRDAVAHRLEVSEKARRAAYLKEVRERVPPPRPKPGNFVLQGPAECAHATDGRSYTVASEEKSGRCGPCREPPKPCCVTLVPDNNCRPKGPGHVDPCAHRPRTIVSIDRSQRYAATAAETTSNNTVERPKTAPSPPPPAPPLNTSRAENLTTRIMKSLNLSRATSTKDTCAKKVPKPQAPDPPAAWCANLRPPKQTSPPCRPPSPAERLRRRVACRDFRRRPTLIPQRDCDPPRRKLHTGVRHFAKAESNQLADMLAARAGLKEIAQGRVARTPEKCSPSGGMAKGLLELGVPPGATVVHVDVTVGSKSTLLEPEKPEKPETPSENDTCKGAEDLKAEPNKNPKEPSKPDCPLARSVSCGERESWLSLKTLQKIVSRKKCDSTPTLANKAKGVPCKPPCAPRSSPCAPPQKPQNKPSHPCGPKPVTPPTTSPCQPSKPSNCPHHNTPPPAKPTCKPASVPPKNPCHTAPPPAKPPCHPELKPDPPKKPCQPCKQGKTLTSTKATNTANRLDASKKTKKISPYSLLPVFSSV